MGVLSADSSLGIVVGKKVEFMILSNLIMSKCKIVDCIFDLNTHRLMVFFCLDI